MSSSRVEGRGGVKGGGGGADMEGRGKPEKGGRVYEPMREERGGGGSRSAGEGRARVSGGRERGGGGNREGGNEVGGEVGKGEMGRHKYFLLSLTAIYVPSTLGRYLENVIRYI